MRLNVEDPPNLPSMFDGSVLPGASSKTKALMQIICQKQVGDARFEQ